MSVIFLGHSSPKSGLNNRGERLGQKNRHDDVIPLVPVVQKVDKTLKNGSISIYWIALLISLYFSILYWLVFFFCWIKDSVFSRWVKDAIQSEQLGPAVY